MQSILRYFSDYNPKVPVYEWKGHLINIPLNGIYDDLRIEDMMMALKESVMRSEIPYWTRLVTFSDCIAISDGNMSTLVRSLNAFYKWSQENGCYASAVVIPPSKLDEFSQIESLSNDAHNGVRIFYDEQTAQAWLLAQQQKHKNHKLH